MYEPDEKFPILSECPRAIRFFRPAKLAYSMHGFGVSFNQLFVLVAYPVRIVFGITVKFLMAVNPEHLPEGERRLKRSALTARVVGLPPTVINFSKSILSIH